MRFFLICVDFFCFFKSEPILFQELTEAVIGPFETAHEDSSEREQVSSFLFLKTTLTFEQLVTRGEKG